MGITARILATALCLVPFHYCHAQPSSQADQRVFTRGSYTVEVSTYANLTADLFITVNVIDNRAGIASVTIKTGNRTLATCPAQSFDVAGVWCQFTWLQSAMPATADYTIAIVLVSGIKYEVYGKWSRPLSSVP